MAGLARCLCHVHAHRYGTAYGLHDVIGCCLDADTGAVSYTLNGKDLGEAARLPDVLRGQVGARRHLAVMRVAPACSPM